MLTRLNQHFFITTESLNGLHVFTTGIIANKRANNIDIDLTGLIEF